MGVARRWWLLGSLAAVLAASVALPLAMYFRDYLDNPLRPSVASVETWGVVWPMLRAAPAYYGDRVGGGDVERLALRLSAKSSRRIAAKRAEAIRRGVLFASREDFVPAALEVGRRTVAVDVRLKGDLGDHWARRRWSLRVEVEDGGEVLGLRRFSLHPPWVRGFHTEPLFFDLLRSVGLIAPRTAFVELVINGRDIGLMGVEEHLASALVQAHQRPPGVLLKLDEAPLWQAWVRAAEVRGVPWSLAVPKPRVEDDWRNAPIDPFERRALRRSPERSAELARASQLLRGVAAGAIAPSAAFDAGLWGRFLAYCEVFGAPHMVLWNNLRFYFNPLSGRLEPVAFDSGVLPERDHRQLPAGASFICLGGHMEFTDTLVADPVVRDAFLKALRTLE
ncbi:MAG: CotH kinase family protein, partial [Acidobacteriota bacterium]